MDDCTQNAYRENADDFIRQYDSADVSSALFSLAFSGFSKILDIGCGSGRDMRSIQKMGGHVDGVDPSRAFVKHAVSLNNQYNSSIAVDSLPELSTIENAAYDGVL